MQYLKADTATTIKIGPFLDSTDGVTAETGLTISQADVRLSKNGGNFAQKNQADAATHDENGYYDCSIDTTDTNTEGRLTVAITESGALPVWHEFTIVNANVYDSLFAVAGTDKLQVDITEIGGDAQSEADLKDFADAGYDPATNKVQGVVTVDTTTTNSDMRGTDGANTTVPDAAGTAAGLHTTTDGKIDAVQDDVTTIAADVVNIDGSSIPTAANIVDEFETQSQADPTGFHVNVKEVDGTAQTGNDNGADINTLITNVGTPANIDGGGATLSDNLKKIVDDNDGATFDATTDSLTSLRDNELTTIAADVENIDGDAMRGTDGANTTVPDAAGTAAGLHTTTDGKIDALNDLSAADVNAEVDTALSDIKLDHLIAVAETDDPVDNSIVAKLAASDGDWSGFDNADDSLEALRNRGDAAWTGGGAAPTVEEIRTEMDNNSTKLANLDQSLSTTESNIITEIDANETKIDTIDTVVDAVKIVTDNLPNSGALSDLASILTDTNELQGLISGNKLPAQVEGMDANVVNASALATDAVAEITTAAMAKVVDGTLDVTTTLKLLLGLAIAKRVDKSGNTYTYQDQSGATLITLTVDTDHTVAVIA